MLRVEVTEDASRDAMSSRASIAALKLLWPVSEVSPPERHPPPTILVDKPSHQSFRPQLHSPMDAI